MVNSTSLGVTTLKQVLPKLAHTLLPLLQVPQKATLVFPLLKSLVLQVLAQLLTAQFKLLLLPLRQSKLTMLKEQDMAPTTGKIPQSDNGATPVLRKVPFGFLKISSIDHQAGLQP